MRRGGTGEREGRGRCRLLSGKTGEFVLTIPGSFRGESDFGQADAPVKSVAKMVIK